MTAIAHITNQGKIQTIENHAQGVAQLAADFAKPFHAEGWARLCGLWHDLGKYNPQFQQHILAASGADPALKDPGRVDHATAGALFAQEQLNTGGAYLPIAYCICGHHAGLPDYLGSSEANLSYHLSHHQLSTEQRTNASHEVVSLNPPCIQDDIKVWHLWIRMLYSCLVDADYLDTERFMQPEQYQLRCHYATLESLAPKLQTYLQLLSKSADTPINRIRQRIQQHCLKCATLPQDIYSLTVPTGGGKTLASLVWAFRHAITHHLRRIVIAIPYTSIVVQTASVLKKIFGEENVLEHHSNADFNEMDDAARLATENWEAPIIVTTNVQLLESLYANRSSRCRKLHNLANAVLILDEVQTLPPDNLRPIVDVLCSLEQYFGVSVLLTTATKPALTGKIGTGDARFEGLHIHEIIPDTKALFEQMKRVCITFSKGKYTSERLAEELATYRQVLCVVNRRQDARDVFLALKDRHEHVVHLSRWMCQQHIYDQLQEVYALLVAGKPVAVVSTQLIEAGVDIDFPVVYRAMAGLDSIAQAAGRCNREGRLPQGRVVVFDFEDARARGLLMKASQATDDMLLEGREDFLDPATTEAYFKDFYGKLIDTDKAHIQESLYQSTPQMKTAAADFHLIADETLTIYIPYGDGARWVKQLRQGQIYASLLRSLQRYAVSVPCYQEANLSSLGAVRIGEGVYYLPDCLHYDASVGLAQENQFLSNDLIL